VEICFKGVERQKITDYKKQVKNNNIPGSSIATSVVVVGISKFLASISLSDKGGILISIISVGFVSIKESKTRSKNRKIKITS